MRLRFGHPNTKLTEKYNERDDLHDHLLKWTKGLGTESQPEWVHIFFHTLDTIPMNWYLETKFHHSTAEWDILREGSLFTFSFEDGFAIIDEALQEIKEIFFRISQEPMEWIQPDQSTQLSHSLECYNVTTKEEDEDPRNIKIPKVEGHHEVKGPQIYNPYITA